MMMFIKVSFILHLVLILMITNSNLQSNKIGLMIKGVDDNTFTGKLLQDGEVNCKVTTGGAYYVKVDWAAKYLFY